MAPWLRSQQDLEEVLSDRDSFPPKGFTGASRECENQGDPRLESR